MAFYILQDGDQCIEVLRCQGMGNRRQHTVATVHHVFAEAQRRGISADRLRDLTGIDPSATTDPSRWVSGEDLFHTWESVVRELDDPGFPAQTARSAQTASRSVVTFLARASATVGQALEQAAAYCPAFTTLYAFRWEPPSLVVDGLAPHRLGYRCETEFAVTDVVCDLRLSAVNADIRPLVRFAHAQPPNADVLQRLAGGRVTFGAARTEIVFDAETLGIPMRTAHSGLAAVLRHHLDRLDSGEPAPPSFTSRVSEVIAAQLTAGTPSMAEVARLLLVSERSLHRRLAEEGTRFVDVLHRTRLALAGELLDDRSLTTKQIAARLGFASVRSFHRAYRRWTGTTPRGMRAREL